MAAMRYWYALTVVFTIFPSRVISDYECVCNYAVERPVYGQHNEHAEAIGYMYEFDCKPLVKLPAPNGWLTLAYDHQVGYVTRDQLVTTQVCPGQASVSDILTTLPPSTTTEHHTRSTTTMTTPSPTTSTTTTTIKTTKIATTTTPTPTTIPTTTTTTTTQPTLTTPASTQSITTTAKTTYTSTTSPTTTTVTITHTSTTPIPSPSITTTTSTTTPTSTTSPTTTTTTTQPTSTTPSTTTSITTTATLTYSSTISPSTTTVTTTTSSKEPAPTTSITTAPTSTISPTTTTTAFTTTTPTPTTPTPTTSITTTPPTTRTSTTPSTTTTSTTPKPTTTTVPTTTTTTEPSMKNRPDLCSAVVHMYTQQEQGALTQYGDHCYQLVPHKLTWTMAEMDCRSKGGNLIRLIGIGIQTYIYNWVHSFRFTAPIWLGLHGSDEYHWITGDSLRYSNWYSANPGMQREHCALMKPDWPFYGKWEVEDCDSTSVTNAFICEYRTSDDELIG